jgi:putative DNA primase/helicase
MNAERIAKALGGSGRARNGWWRCRCPVHQSLGPTLALRDGDRALLVKCHAGCPPGAVLAELRRLGLFDGTYKPDPAAPNNEDRERNRAYAIKIWNEAKLAERSPLLRRYLQSRGITLPIPRTLRWARSCKHTNRGYFSAMIARVDDVDGNHVAIHRTYLLADGSGKVPFKPDRLSLAPVGGHAVRLAPAAPLMLVGEGIETCLSAMQACGLPTWAALSNGGIENLILPDVVSEIIILADHDLNGAGQRSAHIAARRWRREGRTARVALPPAPGDFNDILQGRAA